MDKITIIVPCYNEQEVIELFYPAVQAHVSKIPDCKFNYIFVNDGSRDATLDKLRKLSAAHDDITYLSLSRNFGKESAMMAGIDYADSTRRKRLRKWSNIGAKVTTMFAASASTAQAKLGLSALAQIFFMRL